jgi:hypothetical protein
MGDKYMCNYFGSIGLKLVAIGLLITMAAAV